MKPTVELDTDHPAIGDDHLPLLWTETLLIGGAKEPDPAAALRPT